VSPDELWMAHALALAGRGAGETSPNPMVGCAIVRAGRLVASGYHARAGGPHAEVVALSEAGRDARGACLYVNLEPCSHHGRTPPCAPQIVAAGIRRVAIATRDPNPHVDGRGIALLRRHGIVVDCGVLAAPAAQLNERFLTWARAGRPFVLLKAALTLDGRIGTASGDSKWITGAAARRAARRLRRLHDAVLVGIGTVLADDPLLLPSPRLRRPFERIVLDSRLRLPLDSRLVRTARKGPVRVVCRSARSSRRRELERRGVRVTVAPAGPGRVPLDWLIARLSEEGLTSLMVEGGSEVLGEFLAHRLVDQVALFRGPLLLGGRDSRPAFGAVGPDRLRDALRLTQPAPWPKELLPPSWLAPDRGYELWYPVRR
jgi:diaminohydroxyphosphoribosylaminopyrimidine deaminase / 5-amino-6-(5-phosphoribosylamino)uracil reductase